MTFDEYKALLPKDETASRTAHTCNIKCSAPIHDDLIFEIGDTLSEESLFEQYGHFYIRILSAKRVLEYPLYVPGTHTPTTGAWEITYYYVAEVEGTESYAEAMLRLLQWRNGE